MNKKILIKTMAVVIIGTSIAVANTEVKAETLDNGSAITQNIVVQPKEQGSFQITVGTAIIRTSPSDSGYAIMSVSKGTILWLRSFSPTYDTKGRAWYNIKTIDGNATGWILGSAGVCG